MSKRYRNYDSSGAVDRNFTFDNAVDRFSDPIHSDSFVDERQDETIKKDRKRSRKRQDRKHYVKQTAKAALATGLGAAALVGGTKGVDALNDADIEKQASLTKEQREVANSLIAENRGVDLDEMKVILNDHGINPELVIAEDIDSES